MIDHVIFFKKVTDFIVTVVLYVLLLVLIAGMLRLLLDIRSVSIDSLEGGFNKIVTNVLTLVTILIAMREVPVGLYSKSFAYEMLFAFSALLLVLGMIRVLAVKYSPEKI